jgi:ArsR family transcriptional regulator, lead/cadmium/zinc/bismuth-responsive transcriptional repressor
VRRPFLMARDNPAGAMLERYERSPQEGDVCEIEVIDAEAVARARTSMVSEDYAALLAESFSVLGDPTRVKLISALMGAELCVCDLACLLGVSQSAASHQLRLLRAMRMVKYRKEGRVVYYSLDDEHIENLLLQGLEHVAERG